MTKTETLNLSDNQKDTIGLIYYCAKNGLEFSEALMEDKSVPSFVRINYVMMWQECFKRIKGQLDKSLGINAGFSDQIKESDTQGLHEVVTGYIRMAPEQREAVEAIFKAIRDNEEIKVEVA